jgi:hypothetical protein
MAKLSSYPHTVPTTSDSIVISKSSNKTTRSTTVGDIINLIETGLVPGTGTVTSIGVSAPSAFTVTNSPVTTFGTIAITGAGTTSQYIDGTGSLQTFPSVQSPITLSVTGTSGAATLVGSALNIPQYEGGVTGVSDYMGLVLTGTTLSTKYNTQIPDTVQSVQAGGADAAPASDWRTKNIVEVLDTILFPTLPATISTSASASLELSAGGNTNIEIGTTTNRTLTATLEQGQIKDGNETINANPLVGGPLSTNAYVFTGTGISSTTQTGATLSVSTAIVAGSNQWSVDVYHGAGSGNYFDNKGNVGTNLNSPTDYRAEGTKTGSTAVITGKYKQFYGASATAVIDSAGVRALSNNRFNSTGTFKTTTFDQVKYVIALPSPRTLTAAFADPSGEDQLSGFALNTFNVNDAGGTPVSYNVYTFTSVAPLNLPVDVTIS